MSRKRPEEEVNIFSFSFLDILSCTIGALVFILLLIILSTQDMVEKKLLDEIRKKYAKAEIELSSLENDISSRREELIKVKKEFAKIESEKIKLSDKVVKLSTEKTSLENNLNETKKKVDIQEIKITKLKDELIEKEENSLATGSNKIVSDNDSSEVRESEWREPLLSNYEMKIITCAKDKVYIGNSRIPVKISGKKKFNDTIKQFMRYYNEQMEHLWWVQLKDGEQSCRAAKKAVKDARPVWGEGLKAARQKKLPAFSEGKNGKLQIDTNGDNKYDVSYGRWGTKKEWQYKYVEQNSAGSQWDERFQTYDQTAKTWKEKLVDTDGDGSFDLRLFDTDLKDNDWEIIWRFRGNPTSCAEKYVEFKYKDLDNDGVYDKKWTQTDFNNNNYYEGLYKSFNQQNKRWANYSTAINSSGEFTVKFADTDMKNDAWEIKFYDPKNNYFTAKLVDTNNSDWDWEKLYSDPLRNSDGSFKRYRQLLEDTTGNGKWDEKSYDPDGDGIWDSKWSDTNGDGKWNVKYDGGDKDNWERKLVDNNGDGKWDETLIWNKLKKKFVSK